MLIIYVQHGHVVQVEILNGTKVEGFDKDFVYDRFGDPERKVDTRVLEDNKDYTVVYIDEAEEEEGK